MWAGSFGGSGWWAWSGPGGGTFGARGRGGSGRCVGVAVGGAAGGGRGRGRRWLRRRSLQKPRCGSASPPPATRAKASFCSGARRKSLPSRPRPRARRATSPAARRRSGCLRPGLCRGTGLDASGASVGRGWSRAAPVPVRAPGSLGPTWSPVQPAEVEVSHPVGFAEEMGPCAEDPGHGGGARKARSFCPSARALPLCPAESPPLASVPTASFSPSSCPGSAACSQSWLSLPHPLPLGEAHTPASHWRAQSGLPKLPLELPISSVGAHPSQPRSLPLPPPPVPSQAAAPSLWGHSPIVAPPGMPPPWLPSATHPSRPNVSPPLPQAVLPAHGRSPLPPRLRNTAANSAPSWGRGGGVVIPGMGGGSAEELAQAGPAPGSTLVPPGTSRTRCCWTGGSST